MKKLNTTYLDNLVSKILSETLEEKADTLVSKIKGDMCEQCGTNRGDMEEGIYDVDDIDNSNEFDYVEEEEIKFKDEPNVKGCKFHMEHFGKDNPMTIETCQGVNINEALKGRQRKLDKNKNNKIDAEDFKLLRKDKKDKSGDSVKFSNRYGMEEQETQEGKEKFIQKATESSFKRYCGGEITKSCIDKAMESGSSSLVKKASFAKNIKGYEGAKPKKKIKESYQLTESEMIKLIEKIVLEQKSKTVKDPAEKNNIKGMGGSPRGLEVYKKAYNGSGKENEDYLKDVTKKMKDYLKDGSKGEYDMNPKIFPVGNGELEKMDKKAFEMTDDLEDFNYEIAGLNLPTPDAIEFNEDFMEKLYKGDSTTGNAPGGNALESKANDRFDKLRKKNTLKKLKDQSYNRVSQPVYNEKSGTEKGKGISIKLESVEDKKTKQINEEFNRMKSLIGYDRKTQ